MPIRRKYHGVYYHSSPPRSKQHILSTSLFSFHHEIAPFPSREQIFSHLHKRKRLSTYLHSIVLFHESDFVIELLLSISFSGIFVSAWKAAKPNE